jgi:hypothetical protein
VAAGTAQLVSQSRLAIRSHDPHIFLRGPPLENKTECMVSSERPLMVPSGQYRAKALEYGNLAGTSADADEKREYQKLQQKFAELADNDEWLAEHQKQTLHVADIAYFDEPFVAKEPIRQNEESIPQNEAPGDALLAQKEEHFLRCLGAALIMQWGTLPRKLQRELFDNAGAMGELLDTASLRGQIARFLHKNNSELH